MWESLAHPERRIVGGYVLAPIGHDGVIELGGVVAELWKRLHHGAVDLAELSVELEADEVATALDEMAAAGLVVSR